MFLPVPIFTTIHAIHLLFRSHTLVNWPLSGQTFIFTGLNHSNRSLETLYHLLRHVESISSSRCRFLFHVADAQVELSSMRQLRSRLTHESTGKAHAIVRATVILPPASWMFLGTAGDCTEYLTDCMLCRTHEHSPKPWRPLQTPPLPRPRQPHNGAETPADSIGRARLRAMVGEGSAQKCLDHAQRLQ